MAPATTGAAVGDGTAGESGAAGEGGAAVDRPTPSVATPDAAARAFAAWRDGQPDALDRLVHLLTPVLWHQVRAYGLDRPTAEDAVQSTWLALVRNVDKVRDPQAVWRWLTTTARREAWRLASVRSREQTTEQVTLDSAGEPVPGVDAQVIADDTALGLWEQVARLPERCRRLLRVIAFDDRPDYATLATQLAIPVGSIGPTRGRCLERLRRQLAGDPRWSDR